MTIQGAGAFALDLATMSEIQRASIQSTLAEKLRAEAKYESGLYLGILRHALNVAGRPDLSQIIEAAGVALESGKSFELP